MKLKWCLLGLLTFLAVAIASPPLVLAELPNKSCLAKLEKSNFPSADPSQTSEYRQFKHNMQLQLADYFGVFVENTEFWITVDVVKNGDQVTLYLPTINFQVGQCSASDPSCPLPSLGFIYTSDGFLPQDCRPTDLVPVSIIAASNNGQNEAVSFSDDSPSSPPTGYIVQVTNDGALQIQAAGSYGNLLSNGPQIVLPSTISYLAGKQKKICKNFIIGKGFTNVNHFTGSTPHGTPAGDNIRDSHVNDAFDNVVAWTWTDNHGINPSSNILNAYVAVGKVDKHGDLKVGKPIQLTNFPPNVIAWDTSVAINRQNPDNIVVSYEKIPYDFSKTYFDGNIIGPEVQNCRAVSFDGGKTWGGQYDGTNALAFNGPLNYQPPGGQGSGDYPGVSADQYGNLWICSTNVSDVSGNFVNQPYVLISSDQGVTWSFVYTMPPVLNPQLPTTDGGTNGDAYDYPHICFGGNGSQYGLWLYADYILAENTVGDLYPAIAFIPINGLGNYGVGSTTYLNTFPNAIATPTITASLNGRFWALGLNNNSPSFFGAFVTTLFKSPGDLASNYAGPWGFGFINYVQELLINSFSSVPFYGYLLSPQGIVYDENRQALYGLFAVQSPLQSQNMKIYFAISRNNGQTWSKPYNISRSAFANRGFPSMALDSKTGNVYVGWYDGRNDPTKTTVQYFGAVIKSHKLDKLVNKIPLSNPILLTPEQGSTVPVSDPT